jgi:hypothetical protein
MGRKNEESEVQSINNSIGTSRLKKENWELYYESLEEDSETDKIQSVYSSGKIEISAYLIFEKHFKKIPNKLIIGGIQASKMYEYLISNHADHIVRHYKIEKTKPWRTNRDIYSMCVFDTEELIDLNSDTFYYYYADEVLFESSQLIELSKTFQFTEEKKNNIHLLVKKMNHLDFSPYPIKHFDIDIDSQYNDDFYAFNQANLEFLNSDNSGLVLLYGKPGTGKTSYLRYLIDSLDVKILYIPSGMAQSLADPVFISMLEDNEGSILIIEDAEETIMSRDSGGNNLAVSTLLNLTDGLLADVLNLKIICTFNTDIQNLDIALLRPGRLRAKYEFKELSPEKAQVILDKQGLDKKVSGPMTLAQLYNQEDTEPIFLSTRNAIGF